jgi:pimeloyl-ACP methyl ester carboxylesterase
MRMPRGSVGSMTVEDDTLREPGAAMIWREARWMSELPAALASFPRLAGAPRGDGGPTLVFPGFGASDASTVALRAVLRFLAHDARGWGAGLNTGDVRRFVPRMIALAERVAQECGRPVRLVGWSLGGVIARELARERPALVERVVTMGSPIVGGPKYTAVARTYRRRGFDLDEIARVAAERDRVPIAVPITAIYSKNDGIVAWQACIDRTSPDVENVEVTATHLGMGFDPRVQRIVAERLARVRA